MNDERTLKIRDTAMLNGKLSGNRKRMITLDLPEFYKGDTEGFVVPSKSYSQTQFIATLEVHV